MIEIELHFGPADDNRFVLDLNEPPDEFFVITQPPREGWTPATNGDGKLRYLKHKYVRQEHMRHGEAHQYFWRSASYAH